tara:strand:+ start:470 stop:880 length:411 start_codon:yes stop_codon:yes gene_type:complete
MLTILVLGAPPPAPAEEGNKNTMSQHTITLTVNVTANPQDLRLSWEDGGTEQVVQSLQDQDVAVKFLVQNDGQNQMPVSLTSELTQGNSTPVMLDWTEGSIDPNGSSENWVRLNVSPGYVPGDNLVVVINLVPPPQ